MLQFFLVFVGITLFVNGIRICYAYSDDSSQHIGLKDAAAVNAFTALLGIILLTVQVVNSSQTGSSLAPTAYMGLFVLTYFWLALNAFTQSDGKAFGWFSLMVPFVGIPVAYFTYQQATTVFDYWMVFSWLAWSLLWFMFFLLLSRNVAIGKLTGAMTAIQGVTTAFVPAILWFWGFI